MSKTRDNHYVPQWYQEGFFEPGKSTVAYLDLQPPQTVLPDGRVIVQRSVFDAPTSRAFHELDLYTTIFGTMISDVVERELFGNIDVHGARAIRAFIGNDPGEWHRHFNMLFQFIDIQKLRTPKGLDWLKAQYPIYTQNELMLEMDGLRMLNVATWSEGVREIVSAEASPIKFIASDHPVTIFNPAAPPSDKLCAYPNDPAIAFRGSQTLFPLDRNHCLILTNLEYARDHSTDALQKRTFPRNYKNSMVRTDLLIRSRSLSEEQVIQINHVVKSRCKRYVAAGRREWLYPEKEFNGKWRDIAATLLPPRNEVWRFGGEMYARMESGHVHYQDEFGRTEKPRDHLVKDAPVGIRARDACGCGSGRRYRDCCEARPLVLRPTWTEWSIRERNMALLRAITKILGWEPGIDWVTIRRNLADGKISQTFAAYAGLWPLETDLLALLPKPDGTPRAVYTGVLHPQTIFQFALGSSLYFGELFIEHPFLHPDKFADKYNPIKNPEQFRQEFLKAVMFFIHAMPLVEAGLVNLVPDPGDFDHHLRVQTRHMADVRALGAKITHKDAPEFERLTRDDTRRALMTRTREQMEVEFRNHNPNATSAEIDGLVEHLETMKESDPLAVLHAPSLSKEGDGQLLQLRLAPNFEMAMYLAQAIGGSIVTDNPYRWKEIAQSISFRTSSLDGLLPGLAHAVHQSPFAFPFDPNDVVALSAAQELEGYTRVWGDTAKYLTNRETKGSRPNREKALEASFKRTHVVAQSGIGKLAMRTTKGKVSCAFPSGGIYDNTINRLLLMSNSEHHLRRLPMAFFVEKL